MKRIIKPLSLILCLVIALSSCFIGVYAAVGTQNGEEARQEALQQAEKEEKKAEEKLKSVDILVCANKGDWSNAPENSVQAIEACASQYVSVDVRVTKDGVPVLMEDETLERTCVDADGKAAKGRVDELTYEEIKKFCLRNKNGGPHNAATANTVPALRNALDAAENKILVLDFNLSDLDVIYDFVYEYQAQERVIFRIDGKADEVVSALSKKEKSPETIIKYDGNIIFSVNSAIKSTKNSGLGMVQLGTKNQYGVIFYKSVEDKINENGLTAVFSMTGDYNGKRSDNISGWDDIISHGYTMIETDYPALLAQYVANSSDLRQSLIELTANKDEYSKGTYPKNLLDDYKKAYDTAVEYIGKPASQSQLAQAYTDLNDACNALNLAEGQRTSQAVLNFSAGRIITAVLCLAAVVAAQIFFYKRRK